MEVPLLLQANEPSPLSCVVCAESCDADFSITFPAPCGHSYCRDCLRTYIEKCCNDKEIFPPQCCRVRLPMNETVHNLLGQELADQFELMVAEYDDDDKVYCSNPRCSRYIRRSADGRENGSFRDVRCTACGHLTCRFCKYPHHETRRCGPSLADDQVKALGAIHGWRACFRCKMMVERSAGCDHMT